MANTACDVKIRNRFYDALGLCNANVSRNTFDVTVARSDTESYHHREHSNSHGVRKRVAADCPQFSWSIAAAHPTAADPMQSHGTVQRDRCGSDNRKERCYPGAALQVANRYHIKAEQRRRHVPLIDEDASEIGCIEHRRGARGSNMPVRRSAERRLEAPLKQSTQRRRRTGKRIGWANKYGFRPLHDSNALRLLVRPRQSSLRHTDGKDRPTDGHTQGKPAWCAVEQQNEGRENQQERAHRGEPRGEGPRSQRRAAVLRGAQAAGEHRV